MKKVFTLIPLLLTLFGLNSCDLGLDGGREEASAHSVFILCEGNFAYNNASLWALDETLTDMDGPIHWEIGGEDGLGDVGQSLHIEGNSLYVVMNNSHSVEMLDISGDSSVYAGSIQVPGASPRDITVRNDVAYISSYGLSAILLVDLLSMTLIDTVYLPQGRMPEQLLIHGDKLYCSSRIHSDWTANNQLYTFSFDSDRIVLDSVTEVCYGPGNMLVHEDVLYIAGIYYDAFWTTYISQASVDLTDMSVKTKNYGSTFLQVSDIFIHEDRVWRNLGPRLGMLDENLELSFPAGFSDLTFDGLYCVNAYGSRILAATTDYVAENYVTVLDGTGTVLNRFQVGALPSEILGKQ